MSDITAWGRALLAALLLGLFAPAADATGRSTAADQTPASARTTADEGAGPVKQPAGSPELGVVIIVGAVGFLVFVAWLFSRSGDGGSTYRSDGVTE